MGEGWWVGNGSRSWEWEWEKKGRSRGREGPFEDLQQGQLYAVTSLIKREEKKSEEVGRREGGREGGREGKREGRSKEKEEKERKRERKKERERKKKRDKRKGEREREREKRKKERRERGPLDRERERPFLSNPLKTKKKKKTENTSRQSFHHKSTKTFHIWIKIGFAELVANFSTKLWRLNNQKNNCFSLEKKKKKKKCKGSIENATNGNQHFCLVEISSNARKFRSF